MRPMFVIVLLVLTGALIFDVVWEHVKGRAVDDYDAKARHDALMREIRHHDPDRRLSTRRR